MAATIAQPAGSSTPPGTASHLNIQFVDVTGDTSYPTGGYAVSLATYLPAGARSVYVVPQIVSGGFPGVWDAANGKIKLMSVPTTPNNSALQEVTAATNVSTSTIRLLILHESV